MINYIKGYIIEKKNDVVILECNNIAYEIFVSNNTFVTIGEIGDLCQVYTYLQVKEDGFTLFGFASLEEKNLFNLLISISGIGAKGAINILSGMKLSELILSIASGDTIALSRIKGLGKKTAERVVLELQEKVSLTGMPVYAPNNSFDNTESIQEACEVLIALGINKTEALKLARANNEPDSTAEDIVGKVLRNMGR